MAVRTMSTRRGQVFVGALPPDFLRLTPTAQQQQQLLDEATAQRLQYGRPGGAGGGAGGGGAGTTAGTTAAGALVGGMNLVPTSGRLSLTIVQAKLARNYGVTRMDPYCRVRLGLNVYETPSDYNGARNPRWNKLVQCGLPYGVNSFYLEVFDERAFSVDDRIAWSLVPISDAVLSGLVSDEWFPLSGRQGDDKEGMINLVMAYSAVPPVPAHTVLLVPQHLHMHTLGYSPGAGVPLVSGPTVLPPPGLAYPAAPLPAAPLPAAPPSPREEDVRALAEAFPLAGDDSIRAALRGAGGHVGAAANALLQTPGDGGGAAP